MASQWEQCPGLAGNEGINFLAELYTGNPLTRLVEEKEYQKEVLTRRDI